MKAITVFNTLPETKEQINTFVQLVVNSVNEGEINPLELSVRLKAVEDMANDIRKQIQDMATSEAEKYGKSFEYRNSRIDVKMVGVKYDYSKCEDAEWELLDSQIKSLKEKQKERETFLKGIKGQLTIVNEDTGDIKTIYEPIKQGKESLVINLK